MKKGAIDLSLESMIKLLLSSIIFVVLIGVLFNFYQLMTKEETTPAQQDRDRVLEELTSLSKDDKVEVFTSGVDYAIALYSSDIAPLQCSKMPCLCIKEKNFLDCKILEGISDECGNDRACVSNSFMFQVGKERNPIPVCSVDNRLKLGAAC